MRKNMMAVIEAFKAGKQKVEKTCRTDGMLVYSYEWCIAMNRSGIIYIYPYDKAPSATTRSQIRALQVSFPNHKTMNV